MATKKTDYTALEGKEIAKLLGEKREELRKLRFEQAGARPKDTNAPKKARRDIARIKTALRAKKTA